MNPEKPYTRRRHLAATGLFFVIFLALGAAWRAWVSGGADWLPGGGSLVPGAIAAVIYYFVLRPSSVASRQTSRQ